MSTPRSRRMPLLPLLVALVLAAPLPAPFLAAPAAPLAAMAAEKDGKRAAERGGERAADRGAKTAACRFAKDGDRWTLTADCVAKAFGVALPYHPEAVEILKKRFNGADLNEARLRLPPSRDPDGLTHLLEALARIVPFASLPLERLLALERAALPFGATLVVVTAALDEAALAELQALRASGHPVALLLVGEHPPIALPGARVYHVGGVESWRELNGLAPVPAAARSGGVA